MQDESKSGTTVLAEEGGSPKIDQFGGTRLIRDSLLNVCGSIAAGIAGLLLVPLLIRALGQEGYGLWIVASSTGSLVLLLEAGIGWSIVREVASSQHWPQTQRYLSSAGGFFFALASFGAILVTITGWTMRDRLHLSPELERVALLIFAFAGLIFFCEQIFGFFVAVLYGLRRFDLANALTVVSMLGRLGLIALMLTLGFGVVSVAGATAATGLAMAFAAFITVKRLEPRYELCLSSWHWRPLLEKAQFSITSHVGYVLSGWVWQLPVLIIGFFSGSAAVVPYFVGQRFPHALSGIAHRASETLFPAASEDEAKGSHNLKEIVLGGTRVIAVLVLPAAVLIYIFAPNLLHAWLGETPSETLLILRLSTIAAAADAIGHPSMYTLWGAGESKRVLQVVTITSLLSLAGGAGLLLSLGVTGPAWAMAATFACGAIAFVFMAARTMHISVIQVLQPVKSILPALIICGIAASLLDLAVQPKTWKVLLACIAATTLAYLAAVVSFLESNERSRMFAWVDGLRDWGRRRPRLRSMRWFLNAVWQVVRYPQRKVFSEDSAAFTKTDPWEFGRPVERERFQSALTLIKKAGEKRKFVTAIEIGCAEGIFTEMLAPFCERLLAVDYVPVALDRAQQRCTGFTHIDFSRLDIDKAPAPGHYDLVVAMSVLDNVNPLVVRKRRSKVVSMLLPGGFLLMTSSRLDPMYESVSWAQWMLQGGKAINQFFARHPQLEEVETIYTEIAISTLYRRAKSPGAKLRHPGAQLS